MGSNYWLEVECAQWRGSLRDSESVAAAQPVLKRFANARHTARIWRRPALRSALWAYGMRHVKQPSNSFQRQLCATAETG